MIESDRIEGWALINESSGFEHIKLMKRIQKMNSLIVKIKIKDLQKLN
ncbi:MAG: hypothetical protein ACTSVY_13900 [Candidatus Helarchaeota archaeon]